MTNHFLLRTILTVIFSTNAFAVDVTFESLKNLVETKNERVLAQRRLAESANLRTGSLARSYLPQVSLIGGYENFTVGSANSEQQPYYGIETSVNIYNAGKDQLRSQGRQLKAKRKKNEVKITVAEELAEARELFWRIIYSKTEIRLLQNMQNKNEKNLKSANRRIKSGVASPTDRLEFQMKRLDLKRMENQMIAAMTALSYDLLVHIGYDTGEPLNLQGELTHIDEWEQALKHTHDDHRFFTKSSELLAKELQIQKSLRSRNWAPKVDLYAEWHQFNQKEEDPNDNSERVKSAIGIKLSMNLFDGFSSEKEVSALGAEANAASTLSLHIKKQNEALIEKEFLQLKSLHDQVHRSELHITMAERYYNATQSEYVRGAKNSPDVLSATERLEDVMRAKNQLIRDFHISRSQVLSKIGR